MSALGLACVAVVACGETSRRPGTPASGTSAAAGADDSSAAGDRNASAAGGRGAGNDFGGGVSVGAVSAGGVSAGASPSVAGQTGEAGAPSETMGPLSDQAALCRDYLAVWKQRQAERAPGEPIPPEGDPAPCFECLRAQEAQCGLPGADCSAATACMERHCLCTAEQPVAVTCAATDYPEDLCGCAQSCMPAGSTACEALWRAYMECAVVACSEACD